MASRILKAATFAAALASAGGCLHGVTIELLGAPTGLKIPGWHECVGPARRVAGSPIIITVEQVVVCDTFEGCASTP